jgi:hypothetical protein
VPVIRPGQGIATLKTHLTDLLLKELMGRAIRGGPVIFEDPLAPGEITVLVVWEAWGTLSPEDRMEVIRKAYSRYSRALEKGLNALAPAEKPDDLMVPKLSMTIGATWNETVELNLLPYAIHPSFDPAKVSPDEVETIMFDAGAIESPAGVQLRFPNETLATEVQARLAEEMPEVQWNLAAEVVQLDDWSGR